MSKRLGFATAAAVVTIVALGPGPAAAQDHKVVAVRQDVMKQNAAFAREVAIYLKQGKGDTIALAAKAVRLEGVANELPDLFPKGTDRETLGAKVTRAKPEIWSNWDGFKEHAATLGAKAKVLVSALESGEKAKIAAAFGDMGKNACGACHNTFRGPKAK